jgi:ABC-type antimicrobial peptide transport system permease subunit
MSSPNDRVKSEFGGLGGAPSRVGLSVIVDALSMSGVGIAIALAAGPIVASMLFQTSPRDLPSLVLAGTVLLIATIAAAAWPAWRAARANPLAALRADG